MSLPPELIDHAKEILELDPTLTQETRADVWEAYHLSNSAEEFAQKVKGLGLHPETFNALLQAKQKMYPPPSPVHRALNALKQISSDALELAEKHPTVARAAIDAALKTEKK